MANDPEAVEELRPIILKLNVKVWTAPSGLSTSFTEHTPGTALNTGTQGL